MGDGLGLGEGDGEGDGDGEGEGDGDGDGRLTLTVPVIGGVTNNLINGMALGTLSYILLEVAMGRRSQIPGMVWGLGVVFILYAIVTAQIM